jgi:hypothetical protein
VTISPVVGIAFKENSVLGFSASYYHANYEYDASVSYGTRIDQGAALGAGIFMRKYKGLGKNFYLFGNGSLNFSGGKINYSNIAPTTTQKITDKTWTSALDFTPGISYAVSNKFHLEASLGSLLGVSYTRSKSDNPNDKSNSFNFHSDASTLNSLSIGFRIFLSRSR